MEGKKRTWEFRGSSDKKRKGWKVQGALGIFISNTTCCKTAIPHFSVALGVYVMCQESGPTEVIESGRENNKGTDSG